jgi:hypothetical protein
MRHKDAGDSFDPPGPNAQGFRQAGETSVPSLGNPANARSTPLLRKEEWGKNGSKFPAPSAKGAKVDGAGFSLAIRRKGLQQRELQRD